MTGKRGQLVAIHPGASGEIESEAGEIAHEAVAWSVTLSDQAKGVRTDWHVGIEFARRLSWKGSERFCNLLPFKLIFRDFASLGIEWKPALVHWPVKSQGGVFHGLIQTKSPTR
jgi:hypothetical protein